ncbi:threonine dehydratase [Rivularia sp. UHCC 0363]|uniref:threonine dehydratase n=1 Tax=Rivularia sp. UHCC 0363 TaxID=3110244 RepID=UPI002B1F1ED2|nr:threonine dehydratase [Rivularia sp. UHCC 0363]MEA5594193.1 threonine dehydratase [Rivularia sp. UHCC 0363]
MQRLIQVFQNSFIRVIALFSVLFRSIFGFLGNIFGIFGKTFGISNSDSGYYVDSDTKKAIEESTTKAKIPVATVKTPEPATGNSRRRPKKSDMDNFMRMAKEIKKG